MSSCFPFEKPLQPLEFADDQCNPGANSSIGVEEEVKAVQGWLLTRRIASQSRKLYSKLLRDEVIPQAKFCSIIYIILNRKKKFCISFRNRARYRAKKADSTFTLKHTLMRTHKHALKESKRTTCTVQDTIPLIQLLSKQSDTAGDWLAAYRAIRYF